MLAEMNWAEALTAVGISFAVTFSLWAIFKYGK